MVSTFLDGHNANFEALNRSKSQWVTEKRVLLVAYWMRIEALSQDNIPKHLVQVSTEHMFQLLETRLNFQKVPETSKNRRKLQHQPGRASPGRMPSVC